MEKRMIMIEEDNLKAILRDAYLLQALQDNGVDNWDGYGENFQDFYREEYAALTGKEDNSEDFVSFDILAEAYIKKYYSK